MAIAFIALTYLLSLIVGVSMVSMENSFALRFRDKLVSNANASSKILISLKTGNRVQAALLDFGANLMLGAVPDTIGELGIVPPFAKAVFRGWVGGVVSVDAKHRSRLAKWNSAVYYLGVIILQLIPYSLVGGAGVRLGLCTYRAWKDPTVRKWWFLPRDAGTDVLWIYSLGVPLFLLASLVEFLAV